MLHLTIKQLIIILRYYFFCVIRNFLKRRFIPLTLPFLKNQIIFDKKNRKNIYIKIRDYTDWQTLSQIFYNEDYNLERFARFNEINKFYLKIIKSNKKPLILDCGSHIGLASRYFSETFAKSKIIGLEPDKDNFKIGKENNLNNQVEFKNAGIGSENGYGDIIDPGLGNNSFRINFHDQKIVKIISVNYILNKLNKKIQPFIIKIDIEGSESNLFSKNTDWINKFPILIIELHDWMLPKTANSKNFLKKISNLNRDFLHLGENIFSIKNNIVKY
jgi:FkbM family methyltransferase